jgi:hypothetical protein
MSYIILPLKNMVAKGHMGTGLTKKYIIYLYKGYSQVGECY